MKKVVKVDSKNKKTKKNKNNLARAFRFCGRALLTIGILLLVSIYLGMASISLSYGYVTQDCSFLSLKDITLSLSPSQIFIYSLVTIVLVIGSLILLYCANNFFRRINRVIANFFEIPIFIYELGVTFIVWTFATILLLNCLPCAATYMILGLILNLLSFCFAYLAYRRPNYKI